MMLLRICDQSINGERKLITGILFAFSELFVHSNCYVFEITKTQNPEYVDLCYPTRTF